MREEQIEAIDNNFKVVAEEHMKLKKVVGLIIDLILNEEQLEKVAQLISEFDNDSQTVGNPDQQHVLGMDKIERW